MALTRHDRLADQRRHRQPLLAAATSSPSTSPPLDRGYPTARWATYKQWTALGAQVRKGERGTLGIFWKVTDPTPTTNDQRRRRPDARQRSAWARAFTVFNAAQVDNDPGAAPAAARRPTRSTATPEPKRSSPPCPPPSAGAPETRATGRPPTTCVMPAFDAFDTAADAYGTLAHELTHWTGHRTRLDRTYGKRFGDDAYAAEELVAELGAAFTCAVVGIDTVARTDHAGYLAHWTRMLRAQPAVLWTVASKAQAATDWLAAYSTTPADTRPVA